MLTKLLPRASCCSSSGGFLGSDNSSFLQNMKSWPLSAQQYTIRKSLFITQLAAYTSCNATTNPWVKNAQFPTVTMEDAARRTKENNGSNHEPYCYMYNFKHQHPPVFQWSSFKYTRPHSGLDCRANYKSPSGGLTRFDRVLSVSAGVSMTNVWPSWAKDQQGNGERLGTHRWSPQKAAM